ncbi:hypothetical protein [Roseitranquillus sediminis]|uniref:hypothetical protein n=1 Tax=Roseitranquillus sediminis TaxID=2809051 RepID=UPI001D0C5D78|nr:hypothetical protein [Roseitranquillus sediminis]MBM9595109.1 hypothetical protein [Roseitranquillus sediminis]
MIVLAGVIGGALWGVLLARKRGGNRLDMAQHAAVLALILGIVGLALTIALHRLLV